MQTEPILTNVGEINGTDSITIDEIQYLHDRNEVILEGQIAGRSCTQYKGEKEWLGYALHFDNVIYFMRMRRGHYPKEKAGKLTSSFDQVVDSMLLASLKKQDVDLKVRPEHRHIILTTERDVIEIVSTEADLQVPGV